MLVDIFIPCYMDQLHPDTAMNMLKLLERAGCAVNYNVEQTCCGQPAFNGGYWDECKEVGEKLIREFPNDRYIVSPSTLCVGMIKNHYPEMFYNSALHNEYKQVQRNIYEFSDFVVNVLKFSDFNSNFKAKAVFLDSCSGLRECSVKRETRVLLEKVNGLQLLEMEEQDVCCGFGGGFSLKYEPISVEMAKRKIDNVIKTGAEYIISTDLTCLIHLQSYITKNNLPLKTIHLLDVLAGV